MSEGHFEAKVYSLRKSRDGVIIAFVVQPHDISAEMLALDIGAVLMIGWSEVNDRDEINMQCVVDLIKGSRAARLDPENSGATTPEPPRETVADHQRERRKWSELKPAMQAAMRCGEREFQEFVAERYNLPGIKNRPDEAAVFVRDYCGIESRSGLNDPPNDKARQKWAMLESQYQAYLSDKRYGPQMR